MNYKKIIRNRGTRMKILNTLNFIPDKLMIKLQYYIKHNRRLNLNTPSRFTEKIQYYKLYYRNKQLSQCVDKYLVREYVKSKGLEEILNTLYGVYENVAEIDLASLPNQFVLKSTNGGGGINIIICKDKEKLDFESIKDTLENWLVPKKISSGREWAYQGLKPRIIAEKYLINEDSPTGGINDYKFFCFNGKPEYIALDVDRYTNHKRNFYDVDWNYLGVTFDRPSLGDVLPKPKGLKEMLDVATILSKDFPFVRVDLYYVNRSVVFGEMTFYPWSGYAKFFPDKYDYILGEKFDLKNIIVN